MTVQAAIEILKTLPPELDLCVHDGLDPSDFHVARKIHIDQMPIIGESDTVRKDRVFVE